MTPGRPTVLPSSASLIGGERVAFDDAAQLPVVDPSSGTPVTTVPDVGERGVDLAVRAAREGARIWRETTPRDRSTAVARLGDALEAHADEFAQLEALDVGKPYDGARAEMLSSADRWRFFAYAARTLTVPAAAEYRDNITSVTRRDPVGVIAVMVPWNYPMGLFAWKVAPALATGNAVVVKPAEQTPLTTLRFAELAQEHLPPGVLNIVTGDGPSTGAALVRHRGVRMVSLTGETATGKAVMQAAAEGVKRVHLELGGNAPVLVFADADLERLAEALPMATFRNTGQDCHAASRFYAVGDLAEEVVSVASRVAGTIVTGDPFDPRTAMGPLVSGEQLDRVSGLVDRAVGNGARKVVGGQVGGSAGFFFPPTVIEGARAGDEIVEAEVFGPVITVSSFESERAMIDAANDSPYGLTASVWTQDIDRAFRIAKQLDVQTVWINDHGKTVTEVPYGGMKESGVGRELGTVVLEEHTELRHFGVGVAR